MVLPSGRLPPIYTLSESLTEEGEVEEEETSRIRQRKRNPFKPYNFSSSFFGRG